MKIYDHLPENLWKWAERQPLIFVASAPLHGKHVNCSPKGLTNSTFTIFDKHHCGYLDYTGSGSETIAHIYENGRVTVMFCSFDTLPRIMRFFCWGSVIEYDDPRFDSTLHRMGKEKKTGMRAIIMLEMWKVQTSCGTGVPLVGRPQTEEEEMENNDGVADGQPTKTYVYDHFKDRKSMLNWCNNMENKGKLKSFMNEHNYDSLDGLTALKMARRGIGENMLLADLRVWYRRVFVGQFESILIGIILGIFVAPLIIYLFSGNVERLRLESGFHVASLGFRDVEEL